MEHRPTLICSVLLFVLLLGQTDAYSKYGRSCADIGCLSSETCVMAHDSCSYNQRENKDCGRYPTCKKISGGSSSSPGAVLNNAPENTRPVSSSNNYNPNYNTNPNYNNQQPASAPQNPYPNIYPQIPGQQFPGQQPPYYPPPGQQPPPYGGQQPYPSPNQPYPNQPYPNQPPYGQNPNGYNPYSNPSNFPQFPNYRNIPTTTEPSLWNQFLYNKQRGYYGAATKASATSLILVGLSTVVSLLAVNLMRN